MELLLGAYAARRRDLVIDVRPGLVTLADAGQLEQVLLNLVRNASPAMRVIDRGEITSLAVSAVLGIVRQHDDELRADGRPGTGTLMTLLLPARDGVGPQSNG